MSPIHARVKISHAWMYVRDFRTGKDFGRMVDGKGSGFPTANKDGWMAHINNIITNPGVVEHCAGQVRDIIDAMRAIGLVVGQQKSN